MPLEYAAMESESLVKFHLYKLYTSKIIESSLGLSWRCLLWVFSLLIDQLIVDFVVGGLRQLDLLMMRMMIDCCWWV
jgi:hypothetical protein